MSRTLWLLAMLPALAPAASDRIGTIDFYGYGDLKLETLRAALPFKEGDPIPSDRVREKATRAIRQVAGREAVISGVCCLSDGRTSVYVGVAEAGAPPISYNPKPRGDVQLPAEALKIFHQFDKHYPIAVMRGSAKEDDSQGYALFDDPATRADQLKLRDWTRAHMATVLHVLAESRDSQQRAYAAQAIGYAERSPEQIAALVAASFDADDEVRNNAVRALGVLCTVGNEVTSRIPAARFILLLHSLDWKDRNKGSLLFLRMTASRDGSILKLLREQALQPLREMAQWNDLGHAWPSVVILGRIAGMEESRLEQIDPSIVSAVLHAVR